MIARRMHCSRFLALFGTKATFLDHLKVFDPNSGEILLFLLVLTPKSLEVYKVNKVRLELTHIFSKPILLHKILASITTGQAGAFC